MIWRAWFTVLCFAVATRGQSPVAAERADLLEQARQTAMNYSRRLPDFLCTEVVHRYQAYGPTGGFRRSDILTLQVSYFQLHEAYKLVSRNNHPSSQSLESLNGAWSEGEFGSKLRLIFDPDSKADFTFREWTTAGTRRAAVYTYRVERVNSRFELRIGTNSAIAGYHGQVFIDALTNVVLRIEEAIDIPEGLPLQASSNSIEYDFVDVAGRECLLPVRCESLSTDLPALRSPAKAGSATGTIHPWERPPYPVSGRTADTRGSASQAANQMRYRNVIEFRDYRKYAAESSVSFDTPSAPPKQ